MTIRKYSKTTSDDLFLDNLKNQINPLDTLTSFDHGELDAVSIDFTDVSGNAEMDIDTAMKNFGYEALGDEANVLDGTHRLGKFPTANQPTSMIAREGDQGYDQDFQSGVEYNGFNWNKSSLRSIEPFAGFGKISNIIHYSEGFDNVIWTDPFGNTTVTPDNVTAPNGQETADTIVWTGVGVGLRQSISNLFGLATYTLSFWARSVSGNDTLEFTLKGGAQVDVQIDSAVLRRYAIQLVTGAGGGTGDLDISVSSTVGFFDLWGMNLDIGTEITPYLKTEYAPVAAFVSGVVINETLLMSKGDLLVLADSFLDVNHDDTANDTQAIFAITNKGTNPGSGHFFATDRDPNGNITPINSGDIVIRTGADPKLYQNVGGTNTDWREFLDSGSIGARVTFSSTTDTDTLGADARIFSCTDTSVTRTLTISDATIALGSPTNVHRFTVKDESDDAGTGSGINVIAESGLIAGQSVISISRDLGALTFYTDGTDVFVDNAFIPAVTDVTYSGNFFPSGETLNSIYECVVFNDDGTKAFAVDDLTNSVLEIDLVDPYSFEPGNAVLAGNSFSFATQETNPKEIFWRPDGLVLFMIGTVADTVFAYGLSTPYDITTIIATPIASFNASATISFSKGLQFNLDGTKLFLGNGNAIFQFDVATGYDLSTVNATNEGSFSTSGEITNMVFFAFFHDGKVIFACSSVDTLVVKYDVATPFIVTSGVSFSGESFSPTEQAASGIRSVTTRPDGLKMYLLFRTATAGGNSSVFEYDIYPSYSLAGPHLSSVKKVQRAFFELNQSTADLGLADVFACTNGNAPRTFTISSSTIARGFPERVYEFIVKDEDGQAGTNNITIDTEGAETIDGKDSIVISKDFGSVKFYTDGTNVFTSSINVAGVARKTFAVTSNTGALGQADIYACTDTSAARTLTISTATISLGSPENVFEFEVKDESGGAGTNNITIDTEAAETIDGESSIVIRKDDGSVKFYTDGTNVFTSAKDIGKIVGSSVATGNAVATTFSGNSVWTDLDLNSLAALGAGNRGFDGLNSTTGEIAQDDPFDIESGTVNVALRVFSSGGGVIFEFRVVKNGSPLPEALEFGQSVGSDTDMITFNVPVTGVDNDTYRVQVQRLSGSTDITFETHSMNIVKHS